MSRYSLLSILFLWLMPALHAQSFDSLRKEYEGYRDADRPQDALGVLEKIQGKARAERSDWDFYWAGREKMAIKNRMDWRHGAEYDREAHEEFASYGSAVLDMYELRNRNDRLESYIRDNWETLKNGRHEGFYRDWILARPFVFSSALPSLIKNDCEFGLWMLLSSGRKVGADLLGCFSGRYPQEALAEFALLDWDSERDFEDFCARYAGRAVALFSENRLLELRSEKLEDSPSSTSDDFRSLRQSCVEFGRKVRSFKGEDRLLADCITVPHPLIGRLDAEELSFTIDNSRLTMVCRNRKEAVFSLKDESGKTVFHRKMVNERDSYHLRDTVMIQLPALDDGRYRMIAGKEENGAGEVWYEKYTLSLYSRTDAQGTGIFVTDHVTGEPLDRVNLVVASGESTREFKGVELDGGFAYIPCALDPKIAGTLAVWCEDDSGRRRSSDKLRLNVSAGGTLENESLCAQLLTDKGAYVPGERIRYKVILYYKGVELRQAPAGMKVKVSFRGADGKDMRTDILTTGDMGSANGSFSTGSMERSGFCRILAEVDGKRVADTSVRVDEFVLPAYDVVWEDSWRISPDADGNLLLRGKVVSFSGKILDPSSLRYMLETSWYGTSSQNAMEEGILDCDSAGNFRIRKSIPAGSTYAFLHMTVKIVDAAGQVQEFSRHWNYAASSETPSGKETYVFHELGGKDSIGARVVAGERPVWVLAELFGRGALVLERKVVRLDPGADGIAAADVAFPFKKNYPELMSMSLHYFHDSSSEHWDKCARKHPDTYNLPMEFTSFTDMTGPRSLNTFRVHTLPGVEACLSVYDKSSEAMNPNRWEQLSPLTYSALSLPYHTEKCGTDKSRIHGKIYIAGRKAMLSADSNASAVEQESVSATMSQPAVRSDFRTSLAWEPELRSDRNGDMEFTVTAADKLSTFLVQIFGHDAKMRNAVLSREMLVTLPVQLTVQPPRYLYDGDRCVLRFSLSNNFDRTVRGVFSVEGKDSMIEIPAFGTVPAETELDMAGLAGTEKTLTASFRPDEAGLAGDAVRLSIPVRESRQTLVEAHSAVLTAGTDPRVLEEELRARFVNAPGASASMSCISIREMLDNALPELAEPRSENVIDNLNALYSDALLRKMGREGLENAKRAEIMGKVLGCLCADGGFAWFKGMKSSPLITAWVMETCARAGLDGIVNASAAAYLDAAALAAVNAPEGRIMTCGIETYAYVRSLYPQFDFNTSSVDRKALRAFRKSLKNFLVPSGNRGRQGDTSGKVRRVLTLNALAAAPELASAWGLRSIGKLRSSAEADMESLRQYAVPHHGGGLYYPGSSSSIFHMLDGELYVHTLLCELFEGTEIADGIRLWLMLQKETQQWKADPAFVEALACVQKASQNILDTQVMALSSEFTLPFDDIRATGNGFSVQTRYLRDGKPLAEGDTLKVGDRITMVTGFGSDDMRSFVRLSVPRPANLRPVNQKSSPFWGGWYAVRADRTDYWLETCTELMEVHEDCHVTAEGCFHSAARSIECLYAPHYRANEKAPGVLVSRF